MVVAEIDGIIKINSLISEIRNEFQLRGTKHTLLLHQKLFIIVVYTEPVFMFDTSNDSMRPEETRRINDLL